MYPSVLVFDWTDAHITNIFLFYLTGYSNLQQDVCVTSSRVSLACSSRDDCGFNEVCSVQVGARRSVCTCEHGSGYDNTRQVCVRGREDSDVPGLSVTLSLLFFY